MQMRSEYHKQLSEIRNEVLLLSSMVNTAVRQSVQALCENNRKLAESIIENDLKINGKRFEIENKCVFIMATQQPMANDLRVLMSIANIVTELERIGDHAEGIAKIALMINELPPPEKTLSDLKVMSEKTADMLQQSMDALVCIDESKARKIVVKDDEVDALYSQVFDGLIKIMATDPGIVTTGTRLIWVAHNLERSADRVTNICERIVFISSGKLEEIGASKY
jgi:phosphate transport system protein